MEVIDWLTGEVLTAHVFVAVLGTSNYTYAEATFTQSLPDWISSHVRAFAYFGGVARRGLDVGTAGLRQHVCMTCLDAPRYSPSASAPPPAINQSR